MGRLRLIARLLSPRQHSRQLNSPIEYQVQDASRVGRGRSHEEMGDVSWMIEDVCVRGVMCAGEVDGTALRGATQGHICTHHGTHPCATRVQCGTEPAPSTGSHKSKVY